MKIVIAPDSFKESMSALEVATAIQAGLVKIWPDATYVLMPMADGGEGTVQALVDCTNGSLKYVNVTDPLGNRVNAYYGLNLEQDTAFIEMAQASGLELVPKELRNPYYTSTFGTGELIKAALDQGVGKLLIGIGGSATNDAGAGMLKALGVRLLDKNNNELDQGGLALQNLAHIDLTHLDPRLKSCEIIVACDVDNPLCGKYGASAIFGAQKGASIEMIEVLDNALNNFAKVIKQDLGINIIDIAGAGAAGGLGAALFGVLNAKLSSGIQMMITATGLTDACINADFVFTGEGRIDFQTAHGKTPVGVASVAHRHGAKTIVLVGSIGAGYEAVFEHHIDAVFSILSKPCKLDEALANGADNLTRTAENIARLLNIK